MANRKADTKPARPIPVDRNVGGGSIGSWVALIAIGAAYADKRIGEAVTADTPMILEGPTHVIEARGQHDALRLFLATPEAAALNLDNWPDDETGRRLLYVCRVEQLPFFKLDASKIATSTTHRKSNGAPIRYYHD